MTISPAKDNETVQVKSQLDITQDTEALSPNRFLPNQKLKVTDNEIFYEQSQDVEN